jgi:hypothetical protein
VRAQASTNAAPKRKKPEHLGARAKSTPKEEGGGDSQNIIAARIASQHDNFYL